MEHTTRFGRRLLQVLALPVLMVAAYQFLATRAQNPYFPTVGHIWDAFVLTWLGDGFARNVVPSMTNLAVGYLAGVLLGITCGVAVASFRVARLAINPLVSFALALPAVALVPLFITAVGIGQLMQQSLIAFSTFIYMFVNTTDGLVRKNQGLEDVSAAFRIEGLRRLLVVSLPSISPRLLGAGRATLSLAVLIMVVSEMVGASEGIGAVTLIAQQSFQYNVMWAGMLLVAVVGIGLNALYSLFELPLLRRMGLRQPRARKASR